MAACMSRAPSSTCIARPYPTEELLIYGGCSCGRPTFRCCSQCRVVFSMRVDVCYVTFCAVAPCGCVCAHPHGVYSQGSSLINRLTESARAPSFMWMGFEKVRRRPD
eukprot:4882065-Prymnesium_polylepis.1